jgi:hypothetical protein
MYQLVSLTVVSGIVFVYVLCELGNLLVSYVIAYLRGRMHLLLRLLTSFAKVIHS